MLVSSFFTDRPQALDLVGLFRVRFAYGHVGIFRWIVRFLDRKGFRLRRNPQVVFERVHNIVMPDVEERKPPIFPRRLIGKDRTRKAGLGGPAFKASRHFQSALRVRRSSAARSRRTRRSA